MAYYTYKIIRDLIPEWFQKEYKRYNDEVFYEGAKEYSYDGDPGYDGDFNCMVATYIKFLQEFDANSIPFENTKELNAFFSLEGEF